MSRQREADWDEFETLLRSRHGELRRFAHHLVGDDDRAQDALQDAYLKAFRAFGRFRETESGAALRWLYRIVHHSCIDELRRSKRSRISAAELGETVDPAAGPEHAVQLRLTVREALAGLSVDARAAVLLVDGAGLDYRAAAEVLSIPEGTLASRLSVARAALRSALAGHEAAREKENGHAQQ